MLRVRSLSIASRSLNFPPYKIFNPYWTCKILPKRAPDSGLLEQHVFRWASMCILWPNCVGQYMHRSIVSVMSALNSVYVTVHRFYWLYIAICQAYFWFWSMCIYIKYIVYSIQLHKRLDDKCIFAYFFIDTKKQAKQLTGWYDI